MQSRREFLGKSALFAGGLFLLPKSKWSTYYDRKRIGLQLYTVRDAMAKDPKGTLAKVAQIGYKEMEGATYTGTELYYGMTPKDFLKVIDDNGLSIVSSHYLLGSFVEGQPAPKGTIENDWQRAVDDAASIGQKYMVCAYLPDFIRKTPDDFKKIAAHFNKAGEICKKSGIQFCYHNHDFEFVKVDGQLPYNLLLHETDKNLVKMEMDIYWVTKGGADPLTLFRENPGRFVLWHVKDMDNTPKHFFTEVGSGIIDFKAIFAHAKESGMQHFFVEQDICPGSPFVSIAKSYNYLKKMLS